MKVFHVKVVDVVFKVKGNPFFSERRVTLLCRRRLGYKPNMAPDLKIHCRRCRARVNQ